MNSRMHSCWIEIQKTPTLISNYISMHQSWGWFRGGVGASCIPQCPPSGTWHPIFTSLPLLASLSKAPKLLVALSLFLVSQASITTLTPTFHLLLSCTTSFYLAALSSVPSRSVFMLSSHCCLGLPWCLVPSTSASKIRLFHRCSRYALPIPFSAISHCSGYHVFCLCLPALTYISASTLHLFEISLDFPWCHYFI